MTGRAFDPMAARQKQGAARLGIAVEEYRRQNAAGFEWCSGHQRWCRREGFYRRADRWTGLDSQCSDASREYAREYQRRRRAS